MFNKECKFTDEQLESAAKVLISKMDLKEKAMYLSGDWQMMRDSMKYKRTYNPVPIESHGNKRLGLKPAVAFTDGPRGVVMGNSTCFPVSMARAASFDRELEHEIGEAIGREARAQGANYFAGVCINLLMHPAGGRAQESYGEDPFLVGEMGSQLADAVQKHNVMACAKHYAVNNMENLRFHVSVDCDERTLHEVYLPHFKKCVTKAHCASLMGSYNRFRKDQASESKELLTTILRDDWGFEGFTITDFIFALRDGAKAIEAGMDMEMPLPCHFGLELVQAVESGRLKEEVLDQALLRVLKTSMAFQNSPDPETYDKSVIACKKHTDLARRAAEESMVLLKNEGGVLPLAKEVKKVVVIGHLADQPNTGDHGSSSVYPPYVVTALEGLKEKLGAGTEIVHLDERDLEQIRTQAKDADAVIVIAGNDYNDEGEFVMPDKELNPVAIMGQGFINNGHPFIGKMMQKVPADKAAGSYTSAEGVAVGGDRKSLSLRPAEIAAIKEAAQVNPKTVVSLVCGSMLMTKEWDDCVPGILISWYAGMEGGHTLADVLFGDVNPSGKLPFTIPTDEKHLPEVDFFNADDVWYDYYHGYRKLDHEGNKAAYPFGYGLSYTTFAYGTPAVEKTADGVRVTVDVTNTGSVDGTEITEVYVSVPKSAVERHVKELKGFARTALAAGETKTVVIDIPEEELKYYNPADRSWVLEKTTYRFLTGPSSDEAVLQAAELAL